MRKKRNHGGITTPKSDVEVDMSPLITAHYRQVGRLVSKRILDGPAQTIANVCTLVLCDFVVLVKGKHGPTCCRFMLPVPKKSILPTRVWSECGKRHPSASHTIRGHVIPHFKHGRDMPATWRMSPLPKELATLPTVLAMSRGKQGTESEKKSLRISVKCRIDRRAGKRHNWRW